MRTEPIDWEAAMMESQKNTRLTAKLTERVLSSLTEVIEGQRGSTRTLAKLEKALEEIKTEQYNLSSSVTLQQRSNSKTVVKKQTYHRFWLGIAFVVGAVFGGFIMSW